MFASTRQFVGRKWGTANPVIKFAIRRLDPRDYAGVSGTYSIRVADAAHFVRELVGTNSVFLIDQIVDQLRDLVVAKVSTESLADGGISRSSSSRRSILELGVRVRDRAAPDFAKYGLDLTGLVIENVSLPPEVEAALDQRSKMQMIGNLDQYAALQQLMPLRRRCAKSEKQWCGRWSIGIGMGAGDQSARDVRRKRASRDATGSPSANDSNSRLVLRRCAGATGTGRHVFARRTRRIGKR